MDNNANDTNIQIKHYNVAKIKQPEYIKVQPHVGDDGIYMPINPYVLEGTNAMYRMVMSKEMFIEAYNKWIKGE